MSGPADDRSGGVTVGASPSPILEVVPGRSWRDLCDRILLFEQHEGVETELTGSAVTLDR